MSDISGRIALVTGSSRGIGRAIAVALASCGVDLAVNYLNREQEAAETRRMIEDLGRKCCVVQADVSIPVEVDRMISTIEQELGHAGILVNNAGVVFRAKLEEILPSDWDRVLNVNLKSAFLVTQAVVPAMREAGWGRIINMSSVAAQTGGVTAPPYVASKAGMLGLTHCYAALLIKEGITVNAVSPALIDTEMVRQDLGVTAEKIPMGRFGTVDEVAEAVVMLARNAYMTGQTVNVNGGWYFC